MQVTPRVREVAASWVALVTPRVVIGSVLGGGIAAMRKPSHDDQSGLVAGLGATSVAGIGLTVASGAALLYANPATRSGRLALGIGSLGGLSIGSALAFGAGAGAGVAHLVDQA